MVTNQAKWQTIEQFDLDDPISEYGFSTRLAYENKWSIHFTQRAILEYKKFMFLAAISNTMVSPSEVVDIVWHQHLIFTKSYSDLAKLLVKLIDHIPSTHHDGEKEQFDKAREQTLAAYRTHFGKPPTDIWYQHSVFDPIQEYSTLRNWTGTKIITIGALLAVLLYIPLFMAVRSTIITIDNPSFLVNYIVGFLVSLLGFYGIAQLILSQFAQKLYDKGVIRQLHPFELIFMQKGDLAPIVHGITNQLLKNKQIEQTEEVNKFKRVKPSVEQPTPFGHAVYKSINSTEASSYAPLVRTVSQKPLFQQIANFSDELNEKVLRSKPYLLLHLLHTGLFLCFLMGGIMRLHIGILRNRPIFFILLAIIALGFAFANSLTRLNKLFISTSIPDLYVTKARSAELPKNNTEQDWLWDYFLLGEWFLEYDFLPVTTYFNKQKMNSSYSSCGSGCGSSCGGGGGCGGGCGGCGG